MLWCILFLPGGLNKMGPEPKSASICTECRFQYGEKKQNGLNDIVKADCAPTWATTVSLLSIDFQSFARSTGDVDRRFGRWPLKQHKDTKMYPKIPNAITFYSSQK